MVEKIIRNWRRGAHRPAGLGQNGSAPTKATGFRFHDPGRLVDGDLELNLLEKYPGRPERDLSPVYRFGMTIVGKRREVGRIELRIGNTERILQYVGHIGYRVYPRYRGHRYTARATRLLLPLARKHDLKTLWITADPDNVASRKTCELVGAEMVDIVEAPLSSEPYRRGYRQKCRYRLEL